ncbi:MAG: enoyl-CoA hydratase/isomerase family protein [Gemmatimonadales bacterium]
MKLTRTDGVSWLEYHRPPRNAIDWEMLRELPPALNELLTSADVRVLAIACAVDGYFSTGADLTDFHTMNGENIASWVEACHGLVRQLRASPKPLLAAIHGTAVGGGLEIVLHCDVRFAADNARLGQPEVNIGFIPPVGGTQALARLLDRPRALRMLNAVRRRAHFGGRGAGDRPRGFRERCSKADILCGCNKGTGIVKVC